MLKSLVLGQRYKESHKRARIIEKAGKEIELAIKVCKESDDSSNVHKFDF